MFDNNRALKKKLREANKEYTYSAGQDRYY